MHTSLSANGFLVTMFALVLSCSDDGVWALQRRCELVLVEKGDIRFETRALVVLVMNELDFLEIGCHSVWRPGFALFGKGF